MTDALLHASPPTAEPGRVRARGLSDAEAAARRAAGQGNDVHVATSRTYWQILWQNAYLGINGPLIAISILLLIAGMPVEAALTAGPVVLNIGIGVIQEARAKQQLDRIALLRRPKATVIRDGVERDLDPSELVVGDLVVARRGDQIVVDGTVAGDGRVELDESLLTGESDPVSKERGEPIFSGTAVLSGTVAYEAERVGEATVANQSPRRGAPDGRRPDAVAEGHRHDHLGDRRTRGRRRGDRCRHRVARARASTPGSRSRRRRSSSRLCRRASRS